MVDIDNGIQFILELIADDDKKSIQDGIKNYENSRIIRLLRAVGPFLLQKTWPKLGL